MFGSFFGSARITIRHGILICPPQTLFIVKTLAALFRMENPDIKIDVTMLNPQGYVGSGDPYLGLIGAGKPPATGEFFFHSDYSAINALHPLEDLPGFKELVAHLVPGAAFPTTGHVQRAACSCAWSEDQCAALYREHRVSETGRNP